MPPPVPVTTIKQPEAERLLRLLREHAVPRPASGLRSAEPVLPSQGINTVDEVPDSAWYTNRHAQPPMTMAELKPGRRQTSRPPAPGKWTVVAAKNEGITPGFRDPRRRRPPVPDEVRPAHQPRDGQRGRCHHFEVLLRARATTCPRTTSCTSTAARSTIAEDTQMKDAHGNSAPIRQPDIDEMLAKAPRTADGRYRALASLSDPGQAARTVPVSRHAQRRSERPGPARASPRPARLRTLCAWLGHDDSKALNTLDMLVDRGWHAVREALPDRFRRLSGQRQLHGRTARATATCTCSTGSPRRVQFFTLGTVRAEVAAREISRNCRRPGRFEYEVFDPVKWVPGLSEHRFRNENPADRAWAARKIAAFTDEEIRAMVSTGQVQRSGGRSLGGASA